MKRLVLVIPLLLVLGVLGLMGFGIYWNTEHLQREVPSPLINQPAPDFKLPRLMHPDQQVSKADLLGNPYLLNVFGSWCFACGEEHPVLMNFASQLGVPLIGYNYKDRPEDAKAWLAKHGNPYHMVIADTQGLTAIDFGVYGAPETYLIDARGIIRYKHIGPLTPELVRKVLEPKIRALKQGPKS